MVRSVAWSGGESLLKREGPPFCAAGQTSLLLLGFCGAVSQSVEKKEREVLPSFEGQCEGQSILTDGQEALSQLLVSVVPALVK